MVPASPAATQPAHLGRTALYEEVAERLRQLIFARQLEPGNWIDELKLCSDWGISRTPMREAIKVLATEGLVTMKLRRGAYVTEMNRRDVIEAYELLALLESDATARVAERASAAELAELEALHRELEAAEPDHEAFFDANERFHWRVLEIENNRWRQQMVLELRRVMKLNRHHSLFRTGRIQESLQEHRAIVQALLARDAASCRALVAQHFANSLASTEG